MIEISYTSCTKSDTIHNDYFLISFITNTTQLQDKEYLLLLDARQAPDTVASAATDNYSIVCDVSIHNTSYGGNRILERENAQWYRNRVTPEDHFFNNAVEVILILLFEHCKL